MSMHLSHAYPPITAPIIVPINGEIYTNPNDDGEKRYGGAGSETLIMIIIAKNSVSNIYFRHLLVPLECQKLKLPMAGPDIS